MNWIKVDAEHMPATMHHVMLTVKKENGKYIFPQCRWNEEDNFWEWAYEAGRDYWEEVDGIVTHWMPYPAPAQD